MAYIRSSRVSARNGRPAFVPGGLACAASARKFTLALAPTLLTAAASWKPLRLQTSILRLAIEQG